jgi:hypothetical protein
MVIVRIVLTAVVGFAASVAAAASIPQPHSVQDLAAAITAKGLGCQDFQPAAPPLNTKEGTCTVGHEFGVSLDVFASHRDLATRVPKASAAVCSELRRTHSSVKIVFVVGSNWVAVFESKVNARPLGKATGAKVQALKC